MRQHHKLPYLLSMWIISGFILIFIPSPTFGTEAQPVEESVPYPFEELFPKEDSQSAPISITIKTLSRTIEAGEKYLISWKIEGLKQEQAIEYTCIYWAYLSNLENREEFKDYKNYSHQGWLFTWNQDEYTDEIYLNPYEVIPPAVMLVIHVSVDGKDYSLGPIPIDVVMTN